MELVAINKINSQVVPESDVIVSKGTFIGANTKQVTLYHLKNECIIPVYSDNESTISHASFIEATKEVVESNFPKEKVNAPNIRVSHIIKGRVPSAIGKPVKELNPEEKTVYHQRCAFMVEIPSLSENVNNNSLSLTIGGVRALNQENLFTKRSLEKFKLFIGFKNLVCTNLCISTDGLQTDVKVGSVHELKQKINELITSFDKDRFLGNMERMSKFYLDEQQFAHTIGKMRMYQHLTKEDKVGKFPLNMNDNQISTIVKDYFTDANFSKSDDNSINLWDFYNLLTEANKSSYIDSNLERNVNAFEFVNNLATSIQNDSKDWFLNPYL